MHIKGIAITQEWSNRELRRMVLPATSSQYNHREVSGLGLHRDIRDISCEPPTKRNSQQKK
jgi:hypothetical protein